VSRFFIFLFRSKVYILFFSSVYLESRSGFLVQGQVELRRALNKAKNERSETNKKALKKVWQNFNELKNQTINVVLSIGEEMKSEVEDIIEEEMVPIPKKIRVKEEI
jgi:Icc-related predicted phosphoesterase